MLVPPVVSKMGRTTRQRLGSKYCADRRILVSVALALVLVAGVIFGVRLVPPVRTVRSDARPVESIVAPLAENVRPCTVLDVECSSIDALPRYVKPGA
jgi:hypothetical protein